MKYHRIDKQVDNNKKRVINTNQAKKLKELKRLQDKIDKDSNEIILIKHKISKSQKLLQGILWKVQMRQNIIKKKIKDEERKEEDFYRKQSKDQFNMMTKRIMDKIKEMEKQQQYKRQWVYANYPSLKSKSSLKYSHAFVNEFPISKDRIKDRNRHFPEPPSSARLSKITNSDSIQIANSKVKQKLFTLGQQLRSGVDIIRKLRKQFNRTIQY